MHFFVFLKIHHFLHRCHCCYFQIRVVNAFRSNLDTHNRTRNIASPAVFNSLVAPMAGGMGVSTEVDGDHTMTA